jgi:hypothetical protein
MEGASEPSRRRRRFLPPPMASRRAPNAGEEARGAKKQKKKEKKKPATWKPAGEPSANGGVSSGSAGVFWAFETCKWALSQFGRAFRDWNVCICKAQPNLASF